MADESTSQPKSILKDPSSSSSKGKDAAVPAPATAADAREVAIQHARVLQHRKDLEAEILDSLILLSEYPLVRSPAHSAASPADSDASGFKMHVRLFQPSDYDDLIEERNVNELCGYTLCPRPRRKTGGSGQWKIQASGEIVKRKDIEMWCSQECARRALYVKVQLNETAAWERAGIPDIHIDLLDENTSGETDADKAARKLADLRIEDQRQANRDAAALARERGERAEDAAKERVLVTLMEKTTLPPDPIPEDGAEGKAADEPDGHLRVEGHKTKLGRSGPV
ncbi:hypothetical protein K4F52_001779 [Lecanicillium sp. MT-2017a]|nr:hypothetical protein K4F52_001779 [Lecanicillium sp. MT-2017a]